MVSNPSATVDAVARKAERNLRDFVASDDTRNKSVNLGSKSHCYFHLLWLMHPTDYTLLIGARISGLSKMTVALTNFTTYVHTRHDATSKAHWHDFSLELGDPFLEQPQ